MVGPRIAPVLGLIVLLAACASQKDAREAAVPEELTIPPGQVDTQDAPGTSIDAMQAACAHDATVMAPGRHAQGIRSRVVATQPRTVIETDAVFLVAAVGGEMKKIPATFRCEYEDGEAVRRTWIRGFLSF